MQKWTMTASHLFKDLTVCCDKLGLKRKKLAVVVDKGCPNLTGKNTGFLQRIQDKSDLHESRTELGIFALCYKPGDVVKSPANINYVLNVVT